ncbi:hypothetical protein [Neobacillus mesonae]|uniref:hypothetical protein n=1 Tax=Neobacillus mesonae TaxID=1193713 RepID=UPI002573030C|nr:hypothetical protein [Neobacillus mesonae]
MDNNLAAKAVVEKPHIYVNNFVGIHGISLISTPKLWETLLETLKTVLVSGTM